MSRFGGARKTLNMIDDLTGRDTVWLVNIKKTKHYNLLFFKQCSVATPGSSWQSLIQYQNDTVPLFLHVIPEKDF